MSCKFSFFYERETGCIFFFFFFFFLEPDIFTSKCYFLNEVRFQKNLEIVDVPSFGNNDYYNDGGGDDNDYDHC